MSRPIIKDDHYCFACGPDNPQGLRMRVKRGEGKAEADLTLCREHQGWRDIAHGGLVATVLDEIMAHAVVDQYPQAVTVDLRVRYKSPTPLGQPLRVTGCITRSDPRMVIAEAALALAEGGQVLATADSKFLIFK